MTKDLRAKTGISVNSLLLMLGYSCYKSVSYNSYVTNFTLTQQAYGYISELSFIFGASVGTIISAALIFIFSRKGKIGTFGLTYKTPLIVLATCYVACYAAGSFLGESLNLDIVLPLLGIIWGLSTITLTIVWIELFTYETHPLAVIVQLACASFFSAVLALFVSRFPQEFNLIIGVVLALACIPIIAACRRRSTTSLIEQSSYVPLRQSLSAALERVTNSTARAKSAVQDLTVEEPAPLEERGAKGSLRAALAQASTPILAYCFFELVVGLINMFAYEGSSTFSISTSAPVQGMFICGVLVVAFVAITSKTPSANIIYLGVFPVIISVFLVLPFFGQSLAKPLSSVIYTAFVFTTMLTMFCYVEATRKAKADPYQVAALVGAGARIMLMIGFALGYGFSKLAESETFMQLSIVVVVCVYLLGVVIVLWGYRNSKYRKQSDENVSAVLAKSYEEVVASRVDELTQKHGLTSRERDVLIGLSKGNSAARIAEDLFLSTNTTQGYIKTLYVKLGVNKKQQVLDLFAHPEQ